MTRAPGWGYDDLTPTARWLASLGLDSILTPPTTSLDTSGWAALRQLATTHHLNGLLVAAVADGSLPTTHEQADEAAGLEIELTTARMWHERWLAEVVDLLTSAGVEVLVLKGLARATLDYPDPQLRPTSDLDLLVHAHDLATAGRLLVSAGYTELFPDPRPRFTELVGKGATYGSPDGEVDLHRLLVWGPLGVRLDPERLWADPRPFTLGPRTYSTLSVTDSLLHACCHLLVLGERRALEARDIAQLLAHPDLDIEALLVRSRRWGAEAVLATAILLAERELGLRPAPLSAWAHGFVPRWRDQLWLRVERPQQPVPGLEQAAVLWELPDNRSRYELVAANLRPDPGTWPRATTRLRTLAHRLVG